jgi:pullulanase
MDSDLLRRKATHFVLWRPRQTSSPPRLVIGKLKRGNPPTFVEEQNLTLQLSPQGPDLWEILAAACHLIDGGVYHYWFEVTDSNPYKTMHPRILCTDPTAWAVDWHLLAPAVSALSFGENDRDPAAVVKFRQGTLLPCDPGGEMVDWQGDPGLDRLPPNNRLVIYELPTTWSRLEELEAGVQLSVGSFRDVRALIESGDQGYLQELGINALELLPPADSFVDREWGYATSNYFAADYDLGFPRGHLSSTASTDLCHLIKICHKHGVRFFTDMVMAFATQYAYQNVNFLDFHVQAGAHDPEEFNQGKKRQGFGGDLFKYNFWVEGYDPISGDTKPLVPARQLMLTHLVRWMRDFRIDGIRLDSVENIANWDFVQEFTQQARLLWQMRWKEQGLHGPGADERFLVIGEELALPMELIAQNRLDCVWNEHFKRMVRHAILGENDDKEPSFEWTIRKLIDCRLLGFRDGAQAINYVTSHDVEGFRNERLFNFLNHNGIVETERRVKLAFVCLLTAVGIPMIFAGEEFADAHDLLVRHPEKQVDPVNFDRRDDPWRQCVMRYVSRLVQLRTSSDALAVNDTTFIHVDFYEGKRVLVWQRGEENSAKLVVVVANFSDFGTPNPFAPGSEYVVPNWPTTPPGKSWREITQDREVPREWAGREPIFPWEAKVYALF